MTRLGRNLPWVLAASLLVFSPLVAANDNRVIVPGATARNEPGTSSRGPGYGALSVAGVLALAGAGAWVLLRGRKLNLGGREARLLKVTETHSLGSRQYLVVASYEDQKFLLGVCPGRIDLLSALPASARPASDRPL